MKLTNKQIYTYTSNVLTAFSNEEQKMPIRLSFIIHKNKNTLLPLAQDIEQARLEIAQRYGDYNEEGNQFIIRPTEIAAAKKELEGLLELEQEVNIGMIKADSLSDDYNLTNAQMEAIMFMIEEA